MMAEDNTEGKEDAKSQEDVDQCSQGAALMFVPVANVKHDINRET